MCYFKENNHFSNKSRKKKSFFIQKLQWTVANHWFSIIFSDETKIMLGNNNKIYVWRKADEKLRPECLGVRGDRETTCRASVMFWGCITFDGVGTLKAIEGNM